jgi:enoyl-CoA hydratase/carnithine racemase
MRRAQVVGGHLSRSAPPTQVTRVASSAGASDEILYALEEGGTLATLTLNRAEKLNSITLGMVHGLVGAYAQIQTRGTTVVVMKGEGRAFCSGGDVAAVREEGLVGGDVHAANSLPVDFFYDEYVLNHTITTLADSSIHQVAVWDGITMGGGVGLTVHGKFRVATENTTFAKPECNIGLFPDVGSTHVLSRVRGGSPMGLYIGLTGARLKAADCLYAGLATHYCPVETLPAMEKALAALGTRGAEAAAVDATITAAGGGATPDAARAELPAHADAIARCFSPPTAEGIVAALKAEKEDVEWAAETLKTLLKQSPTSVKITIEAVKRAASMTIAEALVMEYRMVQRCMRPQPQSDFYEGVRAVLIDKDNTQVWNPPSLEEVSDAAVEQFFAPLDASHPRGELRW